MRPIGPVLHSSADGYDPFDQQHRDELSGFCDKCHIRNGTETWVGEGGTVGYIHGLYAKWCKRCVLTAQIDYCRKAADNLPALEKELAELKD